MNCFQIVFLLWSLTTTFCYWRTDRQLWIAFKLYFYCGLWQHGRRRHNPPRCCELLSNCIFTVVFDNVAINPFTRLDVVNCFQIVFLLWSLTTFLKWPSQTSRLWIAFKLYFYCGLWQLIIFFIHPIHSCELLSNCIFTVVFDNAVIVAEHSRLVVNCFQIVFLLWSLTTLNVKSTSVRPLWIAFKLYFYCGLWQRFKTQ